MYPASAERVGELLLNRERGDQNAREHLIPLAFAELRGIARRCLWRELHDYTPQSGALVHETYLRSPREELPQRKNRPRLQHEMKQKKARK